MAGSGVLSGGRYRGLAPGAQLAVLKILNEKGQGSVPQALAGLQWILANRRKYHIRVANLSVGANEAAGLAGLGRAIASLWDAGVVVVLAAGNRDAGSRPLAGPELRRKAIVAGCWEDALWEAAAPGRQKSPADVTAPGVDIVSCLSPTFAFDNRLRRRSRVIDGAYIPMTGTSMATPLVAAAVALLLEKEPGLSPAAVKARLHQTARVTGPAAAPIPLLDVAALLAGTPAPRRA